MFFYNGFVVIFGCSLSCVVLLIGCYVWGIEYVGIYVSFFFNKFEVFLVRLELFGYVVGYIGKGWGLGNWKMSGCE